MSTVLDEATGASSAAQHLRTTMAAVRVSVSWLGTRKTLNPEQRNQAADTFGATGKFLSAAKKLLDTNHPALKACTAVKNRAVSYSKGMTLPFPEAGIRLIRQDQIEQFTVKMEEFQEELAEAVESLERHFSE